MRQADFEATLGSPMGKRGTGFALLEGCCAVVVAATGDWRCYSVPWPRPHLPWSCSVAGFVGSVQNSVAAPGNETKQWFETMRERPKEYTIMRQFEITDYLLEAAVAVGENQEAGSLLGAVAWTMRSLPCRKKSSCQLVSSSG